MPKSILWDRLERVAAVSKYWADDAVLPAPVRHMSLHLYRLTRGVSRTRQPFPATVRNVETLFCSMCRRLKAGPCGCEMQSLDCCPVLQNVGALHVREHAAHTVWAVQEAQRAGSGY